MARQQFLRRDEDDDARIDWGIIFSVLVLEIGRASCRERV